jgi:hypothetical protein
MLNSLKYHVEYDSEGNWKVIWEDTAGPLIELLLKDYRVTLVGGGIFTCSAVDEEDAVRHLISCPGLDSPTRERREEELRRGIEKVEVLPDALLS